MEQAFDIIVVGAGMMGSAAARHATRAGARVAIIGPSEPALHRRHDGPFSSHFDEARITRRLDPAVTWSRLSARSIARYRALEDETGVRFFHPTGALMVSSASHAVPDIAARVRAVNAGEGIGAAAFRPADLRARFPSLSFAADAEGLFEAEGAGHINPRAHVRAQLLAATTGGAARFDQAAVSIRDGRDAARVTLRDGRIVTAPRVIAACGGYTNTPELLPAPVDLSVLARTVLFAELDDRARDRLADMPSIIYFPPGVAYDIYVLPPVRYPDGRIYIKIGGDHRDVPLRSLDAINAWFRTDGDAAVADFLKDRLSAMVPGLAPLSMHSASCVTSYTPTGVPLIAHQSERVVLLTGGNGAGAKNADELGRLAALLALTGSLDGEGYPTDFGPVAG